MTTLGDIAETRFALKYCGFLTKYLDRARHVRALHTNQLVCNAPKQIISVGASQSGMGSDAYMERIKKRFAMGLSPTKATET